MWVCAVKINREVRYLFNGRLTGNQPLATRFASKKQAQRAYQAFFRGTPLGPCTVTFQQLEVAADAPSG